MNKFISNKVALSILLLIITALFAVHQWSIFLYGQQYLIHGLSFVEMGLVILGIIWGWLTLKEQKIELKKERDIKGLDFLAWGVMLVGLVAVLYRLDLGIVIDEQYQLEAVKGILRTGKPLFPSGLLYARGIAYSYFAALFAWLNGGEVTEVVGRLPSVIYYLGTALLIWFSGKRIFNPRVALFALISFCWSVSMIFFGKWARGYMGLSFFSLLGAISFYRIVFLKEENWIKWFWMSALLAPLHHKPGLWLWLLIPWLIGRKNIDSLFRKILYPSLVVGLFVIVVIFTSFGFGSWYGTAKAIFFRINWWPNFFYWTYYPFVFPFLTLISVIGFIYNIKFFVKNKINYFYYVIFALIIFLSFFNAPFKPRYVLWVFPILALVFGFSLERIIFLLSDLFKIKYSVIFIVAILLLTVYYLPNLLFIKKLNYGNLLPRYKAVGTSLYKYPDYKIIALYVKQNSKQDDVVISVAGEMKYYFYLNNLIDYFYIGSSRYLDERRIISNFKHLKKIIAEQKSRGRKVWLLTEYGTDYHCKQNECFDYNEMYLYLRQFLEVNQSKVVYVGQDQISRVYLF